MKTISYIQSHTRDIEETLLYKRLVFSVLAIIVLCGALYVYAVSSTIYFVIERSAYQKEVQELTATIGNLQVEYLAKTQSISLQRGAALGLSEAREISFVSRNTSTASNRSVTALHEL